MKTTIKDIFFMLYCKALNFSSKSLQIVKTDKILDPKNPNEIIPNEIVLLCMDYDVRLFSAG